MLDPNKARTQGTTGKLTSEFTSSQLIIAICMFLIVALVCFMLGVVVGKYEVNASHNNTLARAPQTTPPEAPAAQTPDSSAKQEGVQTSPRTIPAATPQKPPEPGFPSSSGAPTPPASETKVAELPAPPAKPASPVEPAAPAPAPPAQAAEQPASAAPAATPPAEPPPAAPVPAQPAEPTPPAPAAAAPETPAAAPTATPAEEPAKAKGADAKAAKTKDAAPEAGSAKGAYGIQVASCAGTKRKENAEAFKKRLQTNANLSADLIPSADGKRICIVVGDYPDKESANKACAELKKRAGFADCYVKSRK